MKSILIETFSSISKQTYLSKLALVWFPWLVSTTLLMIPDKRFRRKMYFGHGLCLTFRAVAASPYVLIIVNELAW